MKNQQSLTTFQVPNPTGKHNSGWVLSIDQATNAAGVSLWKDGTLVDTTVLVSQSSTHSYARRIQYQVPQLTQFLMRHLLPNENVTKILFEGVRSVLVQMAAGAFMMCPLIDAKLSPSDSFVHTTSWKMYAKQRGATGALKDIKGVKALIEIGFPVELLSKQSDDIADSILIYLSWANKKR